MKKLFIVIVLCSDVLCMESVRENTENQKQDAQVVVNQPANEKKDNTADNIWNRVNPSDKAYPGDYAPAWGWVLTDWGD